MGGSPYQHFCKKPESVRPGSFRTVHKRHEKPEENAKKYQERHPSLPSCGNPPPAVRPPLEPVLLRIVLQIADVARKEVHMGLLGDDWLTRMNEGGWRV